MKYCVVLFATFLYSFISVAQIQWATEVKGFSSERGTKQFSAAQVLSKPNAMPQTDESACAWYPAKESNKEEEFIFVRFAHPDFIKQILVCENFNPGAIAKIYVYSTSGAEILAYTNEQPGSISKRQQVFSYVFPELTKYKVRDVKVVLNTKSVSGFNGIDAIGISTEEVKFEPKVEEMLNAFSSTRENLGHQVNSEFYEFLPQISPDGKSLYFSRRGHPKNLGGAENDDIWKSELQGTSWSDAVQMPPPINDEHPNSLYSISPDGNFILLGNIYTKNGNPTQGVSSSYKIVNGWSFPKGLTIANFFNNGLYNEFNLSQNRHILFMTLDRPEGLGDNDMYVSFLKKDNSWSAPLHLGNVLNTAGIEASPFLAADNKTLYFSSNGFAGYGKQDIYMTKRLDNTWQHWSEPVNLGSMINSNENESYYSIPASGEFAYFVSTKQTLGASDIFRIKLSSGIKPLSVTLLHGKVVNALTNEVLDAQIEYEVYNEGIISGIAATDVVTKEYKATIPHDQKYSIHAIKAGYIPLVEKLDFTEDQSGYSEKELHLKLYPIETGQTIILKNVTFEQGKFDLLHNSFSELNRIASLLIQNPKLKIRLDGHTDHTGIKEWNQKLSEDRVLKVQEYLVQKGARATQIEVKGHGGESPLVEGNAEINRRVELTIIEK